MNIEDYLQIALVILGFMAVSLVAITIFDRILDAIFDYFT